jgi:hypothetical protein
MQKCKRLINVEQSTELPKIKMLLVSVNVLYVDFSEFIHKISVVFLKVLVLSKSVKTISLFFNGIIA